MELHLKDAFKVDEDDIFALMGKASRVMGSSSASVSISSFAPTQVNLEGYSLLGTESD